MGFYVPNKIQEPLIRKNMQYLSETENMNIYSCTHFPADDVSFSLVTENFSIVYLCDILSILVLLDILVGSLT